MLSRYKFLFFLFLFFLLPLSIKAEELVSYSDANLEIKLISTENDYQVKINSKSSIAFDKLELLEPVRLVIDLQSIIFNKSSNFKLENPFISALKLGRHDRFARIVLVFNVAELPEYTINHQDKYLEIKVRKSVASPNEVNEDKKEIPLTIKDSSDKDFKPAKEITDKYPTTDNFHSENHLATGASPGVTPDLKSVDGNTSLLKKDNPPASANIEELESELVSTERMSQKKVHFSVDKLFLNFVPKSRLYQEIVVKNEDNESVVLNSFVQQIASDNSTSKSKDIIVSPHMFKLAPYQERTLRIVLREYPKEREQSYLLIIDSPEAKDSALKLNINALPLNPFDNFSCKKDGNVVTFTNKGNVNVLLTNIVFCPTGGCKRISDIQVFAGNKKILNLPTNGSLEFYKNSLGKVERVLLSSD